MSEKLNKLIKLNKKQLKEQYNLISIQKAEATELRKQLIEEIIIPILKNDTYNIDPTKCNFSIEDYEICDDIFPIPLSELTSIKRQDDNEILLYFDEIVKPLSDLNLTDFIQVIKYLSKNKPEN